MKALLVENLGIAVRQLREKQGWSQEELAERSGLNRSYVGEVERGRVVASVVTAQKIAQALDVSVVDLFAQCETIARLRARPSAPPALRPSSLPDEDGRR
ncbi:XRE family transcriptional regulator [Corticibacter populi]|uniref:XRE family transcriptional regulator n=1 Tax=Corticibacter populi TaxID=1550736 RepID=A0A3M6R235_9BURK|nr:helix-turn-helix transcriptional regulator [Corticibacter populi]RMX08812.1 XRE family transcriptional regulator [Corticibacter populi]